MNNKLKTFFGGALVGAAMASLVYRFVETKLEAKKAEENNDNEVADVEIEEISEEPKADEQPVKPQSIMDLRPSYIQEEEMTEQTKKRKALRAYNKIRKDNKYGDYDDSEVEELYYEDPEEDELDLMDDEIIDEDDIEEPVEPERSHHPRELPVSIDNADYYNNPDYEKYSLLYFSRDDVMVIEGSEEIIDFPDEMFGRRWRELIGKYDKDVAYLRDEWNGKDYAIQFVDDYYENAER